jgi:hypothetical protein
MHAADAVDRYTEDGSLASGSQHSRLAETSVGEWRNRSFVMRHVIRRDTDVLVEATEVRIFAQRVAGERYRSGGGSGLRAQGVRRTLKDTLC